MEISKEMRAIDQDLSEIRLFTGGGGDTEDKLTGKRGEKGGGGGIKGGAFDRWRRGSGGSVMTED